MSEGRYVRMHADAVPLRQREEPPILEERDYAEVLAKASGRAGRPPEGAIVVGVPVIGLCHVFPAERRIEAPLVIPSARSTRSYASLLLHACNVLGPGPATLESWDDTDEVLEAYEDLGFDPVESP
jgi:hypothetical protein